VKVHVRVGEVVVIVEGVDYTRRQVRELLGSVYATACLMEPAAPDVPLIGFTAHLERLPDDLADPPGDDE
jgi:hypothetical protein